MVGVECLVVPRSLDMKHAAGTAVALKWFNKNTRSVPMGIENRVEGTQINMFLFGEPESYTCSVGELD